MIDKNMYLLFHYNNFFFLFFLCVLLRIIGLKTYEVGLPYLSVFCADEHNVHLEVWIAVSLLLYSLYFFPFFPRGTLTCYL